MLLAKRILDFFFPRICSACGGRLFITEEHLCLNCMMNLPRTKTHLSPNENTVKYLFELQIPIERAASFMRYLPGLNCSNIVREIKYNSGKSLALFMGKMMAEEYMSAQNNIFDGIDVIIPMPLEVKRQRHRGYNQAEEISKGISSVTGISLDCKSVVRKKFTQSQTALYGFERSENVKDAFSCMVPENLNGKHILLVDDVITTGSSILSLAGSILEATKDVRFSVMSLCIAGELKH